MTSNEHRKKLLELLEQYPEGTVYFEYGDNGSLKEVRIVLPKKIQETDSKGGLSEN